MGHITVKEAAARLGCHATTIQQGLRNGSFPVGCAVKMDSGRYTYIIPDEAFENLMQGKLQKEDELRETI